MSGLMTAVVRSPQFLFVCLVRACETEAVCMYRCMLLLLSQCERMNK